MFVCVCVYIYMCMSNLSARPPQSLASGTYIVFFLVIKLELAWLACAFEKRHMPSLMRENGNRRRDALESNFIQAYEYCRGYGSYHP